MSINPERVNSAGALDLFQASPSDGLPAPDLLAAAMAKIVTETESSTESNESLP